MQLNRRYVNRDLFEERRRKELEEAQRTEAARQQGTAETEAALEAMQASGNKGRDKDQISALYAQRQAERDARAAAQEQAERLATEEEDKQLAALDTKASKRDRILRALSEAMIVYGSQNPGETASNILRQYADEHQMVESRKQAILERRSTRHAQEASRLEDQAFAASENDFGRQVQSMESERDREFTEQRETTAFGREMQRDEVNHAHAIERDRMNQDFEMTRMQRQFDQQLGLSKVEHAQQVERLHIASGLSRQEAAQRVALESAARREEFLTQNLGVDPESARKYSHAVESGKWDNETRAIGQMVQGAQRGMVEVENAKRRIQQLNAAKGLTAPVMDEKGGLALDRNGKPIEAPIGFDDAMSGNMPNYVRKGGAGGRGGRIERMEEQQQGGGGDDLAANLDALVSQHGAKAVAEDVANDPDLPPDTKNEALRYLMQKYGGKK